MTVAVPDGVADERGRSIYISDAGRRVTRLDARSGVASASVAVRGIPIALDRHHLLVCDPPTSVGGGQLAVIEVEPEQLRLRWEAPLLDEAMRLEVADGLAEATVHGAFDGDEVVIAGRLRCRYQGGAPPGDEIADAADYVLQFEQRRAVATGEVLDRSQHRLDPEQESHPAPSPPPPPPALPIDPIAGLWEVPTSDGRQSVALAPGTDAVEVVGDIVVYRVVETGHGPDGQGRSLRGLGLAEGSPVNWSYPLDDQPSTAAPPPPP